MDENLAALAVLADKADAEPAWPAASWDRVRQLGALAWGIPTAHGGAGLAGAELLAGYERLAGACLTTSFILSQRDAAVRRIREHGSEALCRELLRPLACGGRFVTVGLSQLTTSRQHGPPALQAREDGDVFRLDGVIPWVTGAAEADHFVIGAVLPDSRQILAVLPRDLPGVSVGPALDLMALAGSITAEVRCAGVSLERRWLLAGPAERVMAGRGGTGGLESSCLALGLAGAAIDFLHEQAAVRPDLRPGAARLEETRKVLRQELHRLAAGSAPPEAGMAVRTRANKLVLGATQAALTASKGTGFLRSHPAQRCARQAQFFLVWSCPRPTAEAMLAYLTAAGE